MKNFIKKKLREYVEIHELFDTKHFNDRLLKRFYNTKEYPIIMATPIKGGYDTETVGKFSIGEDLKNKIMNDVKRVMEIEMPEDGEYGFIVHVFDVDPLDLEFDSRDEQLNVLRKVINGTSALYIEDPETHSMGDTLFMIIEDQAVKTILYARSQNLRQKYSFCKEIYTLDDIFKLNK